MRGVMRVGGGEWFTGLGGRDSQAAGTSKNTPTAQASSGLSTERPVKRLPEFPGLSVEKSPSSPEHDAGGLEPLVQEASSPKAENHSDGLCGGWGSHSAQVYGRPASFRWLVTAAATVGFLTSSVIKGSTSSSKFLEDCLDGPSQMRVSGGSCGVKATEPVAAEMGLVDRPSFEEFFRASYQRLARAMLLLTGDRFEAEELAQDAFVRIYERWERVQDMESTEGYLFRTAMNLHRNRLRRLAVRARRRPLAPEGSDQIGSVDPKADLLRALTKLRDGHREVLVLVDWLGLGSEEAGEVLGLSGEAVRARLHRARGALREVLGGSHD
jgi:RNA polymerase sigma factor (sigma-70 family)